MGVVKITSAYMLKEMLILISVHENMFYSVNAGFRKSGRI